MQAGLLGARRLARRELEERQIVVLLAEAEEDRAPPQVLVGHLQAQRLRVEIPRLAGVPDLQHDVTEPLRLNHGSLRARRARSPYLNARPLSGDMLRLGVDLPLQEPAEPALVLRLDLRFHPVS